MAGELEEETGEEQPSQPVSQCKNQPTPSWRGCLILLAQNSAAPGQFIQRPEPLKSRGWLGLLGCGFPGQNVLNLVPTGDSRHQR